MAKVAPCDEWNSAPGEKCPMIVTYSSSTGSCTQYLSDPDDNSDVLAILSASADLDQIAFIDAACSKMKYALDTDPLKQHSRMFFSILFQQSQNAKNFVSNQ